MAELPVRAAATSLTADTANPPAMSARTTRVDDGAAMQTSGGPRKAALKGRTQRGLRISYEPAAVRAASLFAESATGPPSPWSDLGDAVEKCGVAPKMEPASRGRFGSPHGAPRR